MATDSTANQPTSTAQAVVNPAVLVATPALIALSNLPVEIDIMADLIFENIGGQELINISRKHFLILSQSLLKNKNKFLTTNF